MDKAHASGNFDGVVVVSQGSKVVFTRSVGLADRARDVPMTEHTVFRLASETKQVTALLIMQEVNAGRLHLDETANKVLPELATSVGRVTIRQLLQHVSGLPNPSDGPHDVVPPFYRRVDRDAADNTRAAFGFCSSAPKREPGQQFEYNNCDYLVLGAILERVTGKQYPALVHDRVIAPLHLSSWGIPDPDMKPGSALAKGYSADGTEELFQNAATYGAAGALYGDALDVAHWDEALMTFKLLPEAATRTMFTADPKLFGEALGSWSYEAAGVNGPVRIVERQGEIGGTRLLNNLVPESRTSVIVLSNTERTDLFNTYSKKGMGYELLKEVALLK